MPFEQYPAYSSFTSFVLLERRSVSSKEFFGNGKGSLESPTYFAKHERHIQTAHASGEPLQQQFRGVVGALAEAVSDPRSARKHLLGYFTYAFVCQGSV